MGGIIVIDFIDLRSVNFKKQLFNTLQIAMDDDKAKHTILPMSKFGLIQITRQRVRPEMTITTAEKCPTCNGTGTVTTSALIIDDIEKHLDYLLVAAKHAQIQLVTNPYIAAFVEKGFPSLRVKWFIKYKKWVNVKADMQYGMIDYDFLDKEGEIIDLDKP